MRFIVTTTHEKEQLLTGDSLRDIETRMRQIIDSQSDGLDPIKLVSIEAISEKDSAVVT